MTHIYIYVLKDTDVCADEAIGQLPQWRREQALRFKHKQGQMECAVSYLVLCHALRTEWGVDCLPEFTTGEHGKPSLTQYPHIHFNMSHCRDAVAVAVSDSAVGVDVERVGRWSESVARYVLSDAEYRLVAQAPAPQTEFARLWTQKEAVVKLTGTGINDNMKTLLESAPANLTTRPLPDIGCVLSVACSGSEECVFTRVTSAEIGL